MLKSIQGLFILSFSIPLLIYPALAKEQHTDRVSTEPQTMKLYKGFFPYQACLRITINHAIKKQHAIVLSGTIDDVYSGNFKKGSLIALSLNDFDMTPESFSLPLAVLKTKKQIVAFNYLQKNDLSFNDLRKLSDNPICNLWIPYAGRSYQSASIERLKSIIQNSPTGPAQAKAAFLRLLETKWTVDRINDFCRPETQRNWQCPAEGSPMGSGWRGTLHSTKAKELSDKKVTWSAEVHNNVPYLYTINVDSSDRNCAGWDIECINPSLEEWASEDFLIHRVGKSIQQAAFADWCFNHEQQPPSSGYLGMFSARSDETVIKDETDKVTRYQCRLRNGEKLTAVLTNDQLQSIGKILINGKFDPGWTEMYSQGLLNLQNCRTKPIK